MNIAKDNKNEKVKIRENHSMGFHKVMKFGLLEVLIVAVIASLIGLFVIKSQYGNGISSELSMLVSIGSTMEIIMILLGIATLVGFFINKRFSLITVKFFFVLLAIDRLFSFIMISLCSEASLAKTEEFLPSYALWNIRLTFFAIILAVVVIKYYKERKNMFS